MGFLVVSAKGHPDSARRAPILAATSDLLEVQRLLEEALRDVCAETSHAVRAMKTAGPSGERP